MDRLFKVISWILVVFLVLLGIFTIASVLTKNEFIIHEQSDYTTEDSISMFSHNFDTMTIVGTINVNDETINIVLEPNGNARFYGNQDKLGDIDLYLIDGIFYSCINDKCIDADKDVVDTIEVYLSQIQEIPEILTYTENFYETNSDGSKQMYIELIDATVTLADDGSEIDMILNNHDVDINLSFTDDEIEIPNTEK